MIRVYLCTYNGKRHIGEQLDSLARQTWQDFDVLVSDDGSSDDTLGIVESYRARVGRGITVQQGPKRGATANFLTTLAGDTSGSAFYAFCDQDDIWEDDKLERAMAWFGTAADENKPALYGTRVRIVDEANNELGLSQQPGKPLVFANALVQNFTGGNTMVFNRAGHALIRRSLEGLDPVAIPVHDWWAYLIVSGAGGIVHCDDYASLRYRQHGGNVIGARTGWDATLNRVKRLLGNHARAWITRNIDALNTRTELLTDENQRLLLRFRTARDAPFFARIAYVLAGGEVYRQTLIGQAGLLIGLAIKRL